MYGFLLLIPFLFIRFSLLSKLSKDGIKRAAHFPSMQGKEKVAYVIYQISNIVIFIYISFMTVIIEYSWIFIVGLIIYLLGLLFCTISIINFANPSKVGFNHNGIYRFTRNPMYVSYFFLFIGCSLLMKSYPLFLLTCIFQISAHWIILSEERWCMNKFGHIYIEYMAKARRYF